ncbi:hypothetical protein ACI77O_12175 [Pseudomonas tritici]|uniref:hypothetical protein n=1 Tax=Pseudomonas tritici TaxID=2745518 RepID=UPI00387B1DEC
MLQLIYGKPQHGQPCNSCGYCCTVEPCMLANEYLDCNAGPCVALEVSDGKSSCGFVRNPLGYLWVKTHPSSDRAMLDDPAMIKQGAELSAQLASALGVGRGCDSSDDAQSASWPKT